ncbi:FeoA family protein [Desulfovibrio inopinatus]|uniref:FeoA family protein n=1 Tax=Desulfovibrio inopinatus TaxID=102109 RepID=UPI00040959D3|nr:FeoA family protein [Desulfovibrio inopinatus]
MHRYKDAMCPLNQFPKGSKVTIADYDAGCQCRGRLCALGLTPGTTVEVCESGMGPCKLRVRDSELVLGCGMAEKLLCAPAA